MNKKCIFIIGPEKSGGQLVAKICSHVLGIHSFGEWKGAGWCNNGHHKVCHKSLPHRKSPIFIDVEKLISENINDYDIYIILTTRDITISELSRMHRLAKPLEDSHKESERAKEIMSSVINSGHDYFIWSYETFMYLDKAYLNCLYRFLGIDSDFMPEIYDANIRKSVKYSLSTKIFNFILKLRKKLKGLKT